MIFSRIRKGYKAYYCLLFVFFTFVQFQQVIAQTQPTTTEFITIHVKNERIGKVFNEISSQTGLNFLYTEKVLKDPKNIVSLSFTKTPIQTVLDEMSRQTKLSFVRDGKTISVSSLAIGTNRLSSLPKDVERKRIKGVITDEKGESIIGATVTLKGTTIGTTTDIDGNFSLDAGRNDILRVSFIGYANWEAKVGNQDIFNIRLKEDSQMLDDVVVVGYGTQKKVNLTGAVGSISADELLARTSPNTSSLLQGRVPGMQVVQNSGQPGGENISIQIRGMGTFSNAGNNPLILIDGVEGNLNNVNPNNIESISVLKDAASASIYGSRAANGVVLVTTKSGKEGRINVNYDFTFTLQQPSIKYDLVTNSVQFMELLNKAIDHTGTNTSQRYTEEQIEAYRQGSVTNPEQYPNFDWMDAVTRTAPMQQHFLSVNGGNKGTTYNFGFGYLNQDGIMIGTDFHKYDAQLNFKTSLGGRFTFGSNITMSQSKQGETAMYNNIDGDTGENQMICALAAHPTYGPYIPDGSGRYSSKAYLQEGGNQNPIAIAEAGGRKNTERYYVLASAFLGVEILPGLSAELKGAVNFDEVDTKVRTTGIPAYLFIPNNGGEYVFNTQWMGGVGNNTLTDRRIRNLQYTLYANLNYKKTFNDKHNLSALLGFSQEMFRQDLLSGYRKNSAVDTSEELDTYGAAGQVAQANAYEWAIRSVYGRVNYDYMGKYLAEVNFRYDGTSRLPKDKRWGLFPSVSLGWRISEETFMKRYDWLNNLKVRVSWGQLGNQNIGYYPYQALLQPYNYNISGEQQQAMYLGSLTNEDIKWETTTVTDIGIDFDFFNSRLYGSVDYYHKYTKDILRTLQVPDFIGLSGPTVNDGEMKNTGWEFVLGHKNRIGEFSYGIQANLETYKNELVKYGAREIDNGAGLIRQEGLPYNSYYMYVFDGIYQNQQEIDNGPTPISSATKPGDMKYKDIGGPNGEPDGKIDQYDRMVVDGAFPKFNYGFNINMEYKNFDLSMFFQGVFGRKIYVKEWGIAPFRQGGVPPTLWLNAWDGEGTSNTIPHVFNENYAPNTQVSTWWLQDASYLRLKNIQLGYDVPQLWIKKIGLQSLRLYVSGDNLLTFTNFFKGGDPERLSASGRMAIYPQAKSYSFGLKVVF